MVNPDRVLKTIAAIEAGDCKTVRMMLKAGVPANHFVAGVYATDQRSLAHYAASNGQFEIFETLIAAGADIDAMEVCSWRPPRRDGQLDLVNLFWTCCSPSPRISSGEWTPEIKNASAASATEASGSKAG